MLGCKPARDAVLAACSQIGDHLPSTSEGLLGFGLGGWDFVCAHDLNASVSFLGDIIEKLVPLLEEAAGQRDYSCLHCQ